MPAFAVRRFGGGILAVLLFAAGCSSSTGAGSVSARSAGELGKEGDAYQQFDRAFRAMSEHDGADDWTDARCNQVADAFVRAWKADNTLREALYDAGVAHLRCHHVAEARKNFVASLETMPRLYRGQARLTMLESYRSRRELDQNIGELNRVAGESAFTEVPVLIELATREIERGALSDGHESSLDFADASRNLSRVLTMDEQSAAAKNQVAMLHLAKAKANDAAKSMALADDECPDERAPAKVAERPAAPNRAELELAMGICVQTIREEPTFAPVRNTAGLIAFELRDKAAAIMHFEAAVDLDPENLDARANLAAALLSAGQYEAAERSYDRALGLQADDYEAYLGRALARRGQITASNFGAQVESVESDFERAKELDPERPDAYYDDAIFNEHFKAPGVPHDRTMSVLRRARSLFGTFLAKAGKRPEYATEVRLAKQRVRGAGPLEAAQSCRR
ncbi:MAG: tetratricopeptide repeat protein [Polyangiaceae bacterium]